MTTRTMESWILAVAAQDLLQGDGVVGISLAVRDGVVVDQILQGGLRLSDSLGTSPLG